MLRTRYSSLLHSGTTKLSVFFSLSVFFCQDGTTVLMCATSSGRADVVQTVLAAGANFNAQNTVA
jgi:hypothetical protein